MNLIMVGAGEVFRKNWGRVLPNHQDITVTGVIDHDLLRADSIAKEVASGTWAAPSLYDAICNHAIDREHTVVLVLTPDHFPVIKELVVAGFKNIMVEKPPVSRYEEIEALRVIMAAYPIKVFAIDQYIPKALPLLDLVGVLKSGDPRKGFLKIVHGSYFSGLQTSLGRLKGVSLAILESGNFCLPDLKKRPWLRYDPEIGGMLRDLGTHAFAPLIAAGVITAETRICRADLAKLEDNDSTFTASVSRQDVEMYCSILLRSGEVPVHAVFGKVPGEGGIWSITMRFENGMLYGSFRGGQPWTIVLNDGQTASEVLSTCPVQFLINEARLFFDGKLPGFDGNVGAILDSLELCEKISRASERRQ